MPVLHESVEPAFIRAMKKKEEKTPQLYSHLIYGTSKKRCFNKVVLKFFKWTSPSQCPSIFHTLNMQVEVGGRSHRAITSCIFEVWFNLFGTNVHLSSRLLILVLTCTLCSALFTQPLQTWTTPLLLSPS